MNNVLTIGIPAVVIVVGGLAYGVGAVVPQLIAVKEPTWISPPPSNEKDTAEQRNIAYESEVIYRKVLVTRARSLPVVIPTYLMTANETWISFWDKEQYKDPAETPPFTGGSYKDGGLDSSFANKEARKFNPNTNARGYISDEELAQQRQEKLDRIRQNREQSDPGNIFDN